MVEAAVVDPTVLTHIRTVVSIIVGLAIGRLLTGLARFVQHPRRQKIFPAHLVWVFFMLIYVILFWWWEFYLNQVHWSFQLYVFVTLYAGVIFFLCTLLFPDKLHEYKEYSDYFMSRRTWFFGLLIGTFVLDIVDTLIKGSAYVHSLNGMYWVRFVFYVLICLVGMFDRRPRVQLSCAVLALAFQIVWALSFYDTLA